MLYKNNANKLLMFMLLICLTKFQSASSQCNDEQWDCDNGECIHIDGKCNGEVDCKDSSDEIAENCIQQYDECPPFSFKCLYGGCIAGAGRCNKTQNCADNSDELICDELHLSTLQGRCPEDEMQCLNSKECISVDNICNGHKDCSDGSDETVKLCVHFSCPTRSFQCGYGGCIVKQGMCNGKNDCADGSDEAWELCHTKRKNGNRGFSPPTVTPTRSDRPTQPTLLLPPTNPSSSKQCEIPNHLKSLVFRLHPFNETIPLGSFVNDYEVIHIKCNNGLVLKGKTSLICVNGKWNYRFPSCDAGCDGSLLQGLSTRAICHPDSNPVLCQRKIAPGTVIQINCNTGYKSDQPRPRITCLRNGTFDKMRVACDHNCGRIASSAQGLSKGGIPSKPSKAPWHVAIYEYSSVDYIYFCSGSIVSPRVVISAAHCFWDRTTMLQSRGLYQVKAGKVSNNYITSIYENPQSVDVAEVYIPKEYRDADNHFRDDIAIIILKTPLEYNVNISAVCIPHTFSTSNLNYVLSGDIGFISGFGITNQLEKLEMYTLSYHDCAKKDPIADDKFCIYNKDGASVCRGESGGGYVKFNKDVSTNEVVYSLLGVISNTPSTKNDCTRDESEAQVAVTRIGSYTSSDFSDILQNARKQDRAIF